MNRSEGHRGADDTDTLPRSTGLTARRADHWARRAGHWATRAGHWATRAAGRRLRPGPFTLGIVAVLLLTTGTGCLIPIYSGDPIRRAQQLIFTSEDLRAITDEWERIWFLDQPSHMTPFRTHGGIL